MKIINKILSSLEEFDQVFYKVMPWVLLLCLLMSSYGHLLLRDGNYKAYYETYRKLDGRTNTLEKENKDLKDRVEILERKFEKMKAFRLRI